MRRTRAQLMALVYGHAHRTGVALPDAVHELADKGVITRPEAGRVIRQALGEKDPTRGRWLVRTDHGLELTDLDEKEGTRS